MRIAQNACFAEAAHMRQFVALSFIVMCVLLQASFSSSLPDSEIQALLDLQQLLEYPSILKSWGEMTDFCDLPPSVELTIVCEDYFVTHLQIVGDRASPRNLAKAGANASLNAMLSTAFSSSSLMMAISRFSRLKVLQLNSLGLWGSLSSELGSLSLLQILNVGSNFFTGVLPDRLMLLQNMQTLVLDDNLLNGSLPQRWSSLYDLTVLSMSNNKLDGLIPPEIFSLPNLRRLSLDGNLLSGEVPDSLGSAYSLQTLSLSDNQLSGNLPDLRGLTNLISLNVQRNRIGPQFPLLGRQLLYLSLGKNKLQGLIPTSVGDLVQVQQLDVSSNLLTGAPPRTFFLLPSIDYLSIAGNRLSGNLPWNLTLSDSLKLLDISSNLFTGYLPSHIISSASAGVTIRFQRNCFLTNLQPQNPTSYCQTEALASDLGRHFPRNTSGRRHIALMAGIGGGVLGVSMAFVILMLLIVRRRNSGRIMSSAKGPYMGNKSIAVSSELLSNARYITQTLKLGTLGSPQFRIFPPEELNKATDYFNQSNLLGQGSRGEVYKGHLEDGSFVAVKRLTKEDRNSAENLIRRLDLLGTLRHQHLVSLLGFSVDNEEEASGNGCEVCIVYEYVSNRTLRAVLAVRGRDGFGWAPRLRAIIGAAKGLRYLHSGVVPGIFDNDIKAESILLDQNLVSKVSDYGLPRQNAEDNKVKSMETAHDLFQTDKSNRKIWVEKSDIYNFGLVLLEVILGRPPIINANGEPKELELLVGDQGPSMDVIDPKIVGVCTLESLGTIVEIMEKCLSKDPTFRPSMEDVLWNLQYALQVQDLSSGEVQDDIEDGFFPESHDHNKNTTNSAVMEKNSNKDMGNPTSPNSEFLR